MLIPCYKTTYRWGLWGVSQSNQLERWQLEADTVAHDTTGTGAGKSSLAQVLFRIVELAEGSIKIDGYNLRIMGLDTLRSQLSALPQDTLLFSGTMRENLDPTGIKTDSELHEALHRCGLVPSTSQLQAGLDIERYRKFQLDAVVNDDGENFS